MVFDRMENIGAYAGLSENFKKAVEFLQSGNLYKLPDGKQEIDGDRVYASVMTVVHLPESELSWEAHRKYADIQVFLDEGETVGYAPVKQINDWGEYDAEKDIVFAASKKSGLPLHMSKGSFAIFYPWDAHRPNLGDGTGRKIVVKVLV